MSGRLVILPHKSWNVWNQDNRERVLRDERLHHEQLEKDKKEEQKRLNDQAYAELQGQSSTTGESEKPFRLFEDLEQKEAEYHRSRLAEMEQREKDRLKRKREGVEDWKLGDGSNEATGSVPWYQHRNPMASAIDEDTRKKDELRKHVQDPMANYNDTQLDLDTIEYDLHSNRLLLPAAVEEPVAWVELPPLSRDSDSSTSSSDGSRHHRKKRKKASNKDSNAKYKHKHKHDQKKKKVSKKERKEKR